jgi:RNA polymerase sigma-70 factor (ECF subfamily)
MRGSSAASNRSRECSKQLKSRGRNLSYSIPNLFDASTARIHPVFTVPNRINKGIAHGRMTMQITLQIARSAEDSPMNTTVPKTPNQSLRRLLPIEGEKEAIARAQAGDGKAFEILYSLHKRRVYSLCLRMLGNVTEAEDLTQEAFLQLYRKIATFRGDSAFSTWLHRLSVNVVLMHLRKKGLPQISLEEATDPAQEDGPRREVGAPDLNLSGSIDRVTLERAVENLPPGYRLVFVLHDVEGYEHNEIATMLECSIGNSKSQLHKARMKLRDLLHTGERREAVS